MRHTTRQSSLFKKTTTRIAIAVAAALATSRADAGQLYWGTGGVVSPDPNPLWTSAANWFLDADETLAGTVPTIADDVLFNTTVDNTKGGTISVTGDIAANSLTFNTTGGTLLSQSGNRVMTLGSGGITVNAGAGNSTIGTSSNSLSVQATASQTWTNNSSSTLNVRTFRVSNTAAGPVEVTLNAAGSGPISFSLGINDSPDTLKSLSLVVDSAGTGAVNFVGSGYTGGTVIKRGVVTTNGTLGTGGISLGVVGSDGDARFNVSGIVNNNITVNAGTGLRALTGSNGGDFRGSITLNRDVSIGSVSSSGQSFLMSGVISGSGSVTVGRVATGTSSPTVTLTGVNTYTGKTIIESATVVVNALANVGIDSSLGAPTTIANGTITMSGVSASTLRYTGVGGATDRVLELAGSATLDQSGTGNLNFTSDLAFSGAGTRTLNLGGATAGTGEFSGVISNNAGASVSIAKNGSGTWRLSNAANTYTSLTSITGGVLEVVKLSDIGVASSIGTGTSNNISITGGTLRYLGSGDSTNRVFSINSSGATFDASGTGALNLTRTTAPTHPTNNVAIPLTFTGTNTDFNTYSANQNNNGSGAVSVTKEGTGTWVFTGNSGYNGGTMVNNGQLLVNGSLLGSGTVTVNNNATFGGIGSVAGPVAVQGGGSLLAGDGVTAGEDLILAGDTNFADGSFIKLTLGSGGTHSTLTRTGGAWTFDLDQAFTFLGSGIAATTYSDIITGLFADPGTTDWTISNPGFVGTFAYDNGTVDLTLTAVPEPASAFFLVAGAGLVLGRRRRRVC